MDRNCANILAILDLQTAKGDAVQITRLLQDHLKHRCEIARRRIDDLQYISGCSLPLKCFLKLARPGMYLLAQPYVLDRNNRLVGKGLEQLDLLIGKWCGTVMAPTDFPS